MKQILILLITVFCFCSTNGQTKTAQTIFFCGYGENIKANDVCTSFDQNAFATNRDAEDAVDKLLNQLGLPRNFVLVSCPKINNALAMTSKQGIRYIVYDKEFMYKINQTTNDWSSIGILAHELGHHLSGHTLVVSKNYEEQHKKELEADEFAGFILSKLGASLSECQAALKTVATERDDTYSSHPRLSRRLLAIKVGFNKAKNNSIISNVSYGVIPEQLYNEALKLGESKNYFSGIEKLTKLIKLQPNNYEAFGLRSIYRFYTKDYYGSIADATERINNVNESNAVIYCTRAEAKCELNDYKGAILDFDIAIEMGLIIAYNGRASLKIRIEDFQGAINDCDYVIKTTSDKSVLEVSYHTRAFARIALGNNTLGCEDARISCELGSKLGCAIWKQYCK